MRSFLCLAALAVVGLALVGLATPAAGASGGHYIPQPGDRFDYTETTILNGGTGDYAGYTEATFTNGTVGVTAVASNGTESASYSYGWVYTNSSTPVRETGTSAGSFTFSANSYEYVDGTDNQTGYTAPVFVWFYVNNSLPAGGQATLLNTPVTVVNTNASYQFPTDPSRYVRTIEVSGTGAYTRDDSYGLLTATYTWQSYFDVSTGYIVGYLYTEHDSNASGDGFTWTDTLSVTSTSYPLTPASAGSSGTSSSGLSTGEIVAIAAVILVIVVVVVALALRGRRRPSLPAHSPTGQVAYRPVAAPPPPTTASPYAPPPIRLTPAQEPAVQQVVLRETVKVNCRYCGTLIDSTATVCPNCGAPRT